MQTRYSAIALVALVVLLGGYFLWSNAQSKRFDSNALELSFSYPKSYTISGHTEEGPERTWDVLVLQQESTTPPPQNSEGPPTISIIVLDNSTGLTLENWIRGSAFSNFNLGGEVLASTTIGGEPALAYHYSGLYENDAVAVLHGTKIYFFSVGWLTEGDEIREDFRDILKSVVFAP